jgi:3-hydroxyisobutyrate dehydrogenase
LKANVGVAGLGLMGSGIASRLGSIGRLASVYNRNAIKMRPFKHVGAYLATSPKEIANRCDFLVTCVTDFDALRSVLFNERNGVITARNDHLVVLDCSTILPWQSEHCARKLRENGIEMLGSPVMGGPAAAASGELVPIVAGKKKIFSKAIKILEIFGKPVFYAGERDGQANAIKLALNLNIALIAGALSEAITLVRSYGADPLLFLKVLNSTYFKTGMSDRKGPKMVKNDFSPSFHLRNMLKDVELATALAQSTGIAIPLTTQAALMYRAANNSGFSEMDYTAICGFLQKINGLGKWKQG